MRPLRSGWRRRRSETAAPVHATTRRAVPSSQSSTVDSTRPPASNAGLPAHRSRSSMISGTRSGTPMRAAMGPAIGGPLASTTSGLLSSIRRRTALAPRGTHSIDSGMASGRAPASRNAGWLSRASRLVAAARTATACDAPTVNSEAPMRSSALRTSTSQPCSGRYRAKARQRAAGPPSCSIERCVTNSNRPHAPYSFILWMRLTVDLRYNGPAVEPVDDELAVTLGQLAVMAGSPRQLRRLLRDSQLHDLRVLRDDRALNGVQSGALMLAALSRANRFEVCSATGRLLLGRSAMRAMAAKLLATALPAELARSARWHERARRVAASTLHPAHTPGQTGAASHLPEDRGIAALARSAGGRCRHPHGGRHKRALGRRHRGQRVRRRAPDGCARCALPAQPPRHIVQLVHWLTLVGYTRDLVAAAVVMPADLVYQRYAVGSYAGLELARRLDVPLVLEFNGSEIWAERHWGSGRVPRSRRRRRRLSVATCSTRP